MSNKARCANCGRSIHRQRDDSWYHDHNASVACLPGSGSRRRADPVMVEVERADAERTLSFIAASRGADLEPM